MSDTRRFVSAEPRSCPTGHGIPFADECEEGCAFCRPMSNPKPVITQLAWHLYVHPKALRNWIRQHAAEAATATPGDDGGDRGGLRAENKELRRVNELLRAAGAHFAQEIGPTRSP